LTAASRVKNHAWCDEFIANTYPLDADVLLIFPAELQSWQSFVGIMTLPLLIESLQYAFNISADCD
jgi:hypothetical protein